MKHIHPKIIDLSKDRRFLCLLNDVKIALNYLEQYNGKNWESKDYLSPINTTKMQFIKEYLTGALEHIKNMEDENIIFP